jgi:type IV secretory pathway VirB4 component
MPTYGNKVIKDKNSPLKGKVIRQSMQSFSPIRDIQNGVIITKDNRYIKILEFLPINFLLKSSREQEHIISQFTGVLKQMPAKVQFKTLTRKADVNKHIERLYKEVAAEKNISCKRLMLEHIEMIKEVGETEGVSRRFFVVIEYENYNPNRKPTFNEIVAQLETVSQRIKNGMYQCGNEFIEPENDHEYYLEILYSIFSRRTSEMVPFDNKMLSVIAKYMTSIAQINDNEDVSLEEAKMPYIPVNEFICPDDIDFRHGKYITIDGLYYMFAYIPSNAYLPGVSAGWVSLLINMGEGVDVDVFISRQPRDTCQRRIGQQIRMNRAKMKDKQDTNPDFDDLENAIVSGYYLKQGLAANEDFYYFSTLLTITANSKEELEWKYKEIESYIRSLDMDIKPCRHQNEQAFLSTLPLCNLDESIYRKSRRNILTSSLASIYPFTSFELRDENGVLLGVNKSNNSLVIVDIFNSKKYKNANIAILGTTGSGKTFTMQCMALRMRQKKIQVFIIAPIKGHEFKRACDKIGGQYIKISAGSPDCINIMEIRKMDTRSKILLEGEGVKDSILAKKIQKLHIFFSLLVPDITFEEKQLLDEALIKTYAKKGITTDNTSLEKYPNGPYKEMPTLGDLYKVLLERTETKRLATILNRYVSGSASSFNRQTNVNLDNKYIVIDISDLTKETLPIGMFVALDYVWDKAREDITAKKAIFLDELWTLIGASSNSLAADFVYEIFKVIRGYGGSAIAATQDLNDFFALEDGKYGKAIINNAKTKIILNLEQEEADRVGDVLNLTPTEVQNIVKFQRGNGLISTNNNNVLVSFKASELERLLITTDRAELEAIVKKRQTETGM